MEKAKVLKEIANNFGSTEFTWFTLHDVSELCLNAAKSGLYETELNLNKPINPTIIENLKEAGYDVNHFNTDRGYTLIINWK
jgi:hypothetical protein